MNDEITPEVGDIWKELDPRPEYQRYVLVTRVGMNEAEIQKCELDGSIPPRSVKRQAKLSRFNGKRGGYELYRRGAGEAYLAQKAGVRL